jgi:hypothetical protein
MKHTLVLLAMAGLITACTKQAPSPDADLQRLVYYVDSVDKVFQLYGVKDVQMTESRSGEFDTSYVVQENYFTSMSNLSEVSIIDSTYYLNALPAAAAMVSRMDEKQKEAYLAAVKQFATIRYQKP